MPDTDRDYGICSISGAPLNDILSAITEPKTERPANLESVIARLSERERLAEYEEICYIGGGTFGVVDRSEDSFRIVRRIEYENSSIAYEWRFELRFSIKDAYQPAPQPLSELYSSEELDSFPEFKQTIDI